MNTITLAVTKKSFEYIKDKVGRGGWQLAVQGASADIHAAIESANKNNHISVCLGGCITLSIGDTGAIWRSHNKENQKEFDALFDLLELQPDKPMVFVCELN